MTLCLGCLDWTAFGSLATFLAVLVALFGEQWWRAWNQPVLKVHVRKDDAGCYYKTKVQLLGAPAHAPVQESEAYYFRLWVTNEGRGPAEAVQVFASALSRRDASGTFEAVREFLPMGLLWTHSNPPSTSLARLHAKMGHHCELASVVKHEVPAPLTLSVEVAPFTGWHRLERGTYRLTLRLACANGSPRTQTVEIHFGGDWLEDEAAMFRDGVVCKVLNQ